MIGEEELALLREDVEATLLDECVVTRAGSQGAFNESTGLYAASTGSTVYSGACRVAQMTEQDRLVNFGDRSVGLVAYVATLPYDAPELHKDDLFTVTTSNDEQLLTKALEVHSVKYGSLLTGRKVILEEKR